MDGLSYLLALFMRCPCRFSNSHDLVTLGDDMGIVNETIIAGRMLFQGSWNAQTFESLYEFHQVGVESGTDLVFNKSKDALMSLWDVRLLTFPVTDRLSGLWNSETPLARYLTTQNITTLLFSGVSADQCVVRDNSTITACLKLTFLSPLVGNFCRRCLPGTDNERIKIESQAY